MHWITTLSFLLALLGASPLWAATYHVAKSGSDSNACTAAVTQDKARATIAAGASCLKSGDTLLLHAGQYPEVLLNVLPSGTTLKANGSAFDGTGEQVEIRPPDTRNSPIIKVTGSNITLDGFIVDARNQQVYMYVIEVADGSSGVTFQNLEVRNSPDTCDAWGSGGAGITTGHQTARTTIRRSNVHHISAYPSKKDCSGQPKESSQTVHGLYLTGDDEVTEDSFIHDNAGWGVHYYATGEPVKNAIVRRNVIANNVNTGIQIGSGSGSSAYNNVVYGSNRGIIVGRYGLAASNQSVYNNTITGNRANCIINAATTSRIANNICWKNGTDGITEEGTATVTQSNLFGTDPKFVDATNGDFHIRPDSPAIAAGAGADLSQQFDTDADSKPRGQPFGQGAYISASGNPGPGPDPTPPQPPDVMGFRPQVSWPLNEGTGRVANDTSHSGNPGTLQGAAAWYPPAEGAEGVQLDGSTAAISAPSFVWPARSPMTALFWVWADRAGGGIFGVKSATNERFGVHAPWTDMKLHFDYGSCCGPTSNRVSVDFTAYMKQWVHVAVVSNTRDFAGIYLNGKRVAWHRNAGAPTSDMTGLDVGRWQLGTTLYATGLVSGFSLVNRVLTESEIQEAYRQSVLVSRHSLAGLPQP